MDPNANLQTQLELAKKLQYGLDEGITYGYWRDAFGHEDLTMMLADLVIALNDWIVKGGFLPNQWQKENNNGKPTKE